MANRKNVVNPSHSPSTRPVNPSRGALLPTPGDGVKASRPSAPLQADDGSPWRRKHLRLGFIAKDDDGKCGWQLELNPEALSSVNASLFSVIGSSLSDAQAFATADIIAQIVEPALIEVRRPMRGVRARVLGRHTVTIEEEEVGAVVTRVFAFATGFGWSIKPLYAVLPDEPEIEGEVWSARLAFNLVTQLAPIFKAQVKHPASCSGIRSV